MATSPLKQLEIRLAIPLDFFKNCFSMTSMTSFILEAFMIHIWQLQEAKAKLTQLIKDSKDDIQIISRHGVKEVVVMSMEKYKELTSTGKDIVSFFKKSPLNGVELDITRDKSLMRGSDL
jgi:prevent-host-death family protein